MLRKVVPDSETREWLAVQCRNELGEMYEPNYFMRTAEGCYKCFCKDPGYYRYVALLLEDS